MLSSCVIYPHRRDTEHRVPTSAYRYNVQSGEKMTYDPDKHHRRSIRLKEYDYSKAGAYFITICTYNKEYILGDIIHGEMRSNEYGMIVETNG